jgi:hypothetical protein
MSSNNLTRILNNRPVNIQDPQHPCYPVASVVGNHGNGTEIALHKTHHGAVLTSLGGELVKEILHQCSIEMRTNEDGLDICTNPLEMLLKYEQYKELGIDVKHILAMLQLAGVLQEKQDFDQLDAFPLNMEEVEVKLNLEE